MPTSIIAMVVGAAVSSAVGSAIGVGFVSAIAGGVASMAIAAAFADSPDQPQPMQQELRDNLVTVRQPISNWQYIYGRSRVGGALTFAHESANQYFHLIVTFAGHACDEIEVIHFNDEVVPLDVDGNATGKYAGFVRIKKSLGDEAGQPFADLVAESEGKWTDAHRQSGRTKIYVRLVPSAGLFPTGIPNITAVIKGKKVYDPRTENTVWSENASLCQADYICDAPAGLEAVYADEIDAAQLIAAANIDDEPVTIDGGSEARYTLNGAFQVNATPGDVLGRMLTANNGKVRYIGGLFQIQPAAYVSPVVTLTEDDCRAVPHIIPRLSAADLCNGVKGLYVSEANLWQPTDFPAVTNATYLAEDNAERSWLELSLPYTKSSAMAQRIAKIELERRRQQITVEWKGKFNCYRLQAGNTCMLDFAMMGWSGKVFEVVQTSLVFEDDGAGGIALGTDLVLRETASAVFDWNSGEETVVDLAPNTNLPDPFAITPPTDLVLVDTPHELQDGSVIPQIAVSWSPSGYAFTEGWDVLWRITGSGDEWQSQYVTTPLAFLPMLDVGQDYDIEVYTVTTLGRSQTALTVAGHPAANVPAPPAPTTLTATGGLFAIALAWTPGATTRRDIRHTEIWAATANNRAGAARITCEPWPAVAYNHVGLTPGQTWYYWARTQDTSGNDSGWYPAGATAGAEASPSTDPSDLLTQLIDSVGMAQLGADLAAPIALVIDPANLAHPAADTFEQAQTAATAALQAIVNTNNLQIMADREKWISDATVVIDSSTGKVTLIATAEITTDVEAHMNAIDVTLDAQAGTIVSHTSSITDHSGRIDAAETEILSMEGTIALSASMSYVDGTVAGALGALDPANVATASQLGAEAMLAALTDVDAGRKYSQGGTVRIAFAETTLITHADALGAQATALTVLAAATDANAAAITAEMTARTTADSAEATARLDLYAQVNNVTTGLPAKASVTQVATAKTEAISASASAASALIASLAGTYATSATLTTDYSTTVAMGLAISSAITTLSAAVGEDVAAVQLTADAAVDAVDGVRAKWGVQVQTMADGNRALAGLTLLAGTDGESAIGILADKLVWYLPDGSGAPHQVLTAGTLNGVPTWGFHGDQIIDGSISARALMVNTITAASGIIADLAVTTAKIVSVDAAKVSAASLSALSAILGAVHAGSIDIDTTGFVKSGQSAYDTGTGFWLGMSGGVPLVSIGSAAAGLLWNGSVLTVRGDIIASGNIQDGAVSTTVLGNVDASVACTQYAWVTVATATISSTGQPIRISAQATIAVGAATAWGYGIRVRRGTSTIMLMPGVDPPTSTTANLHPPATPTIAFDDGVAAATYTYALQVYALDASTSASFRKMTLSELKK